jgi:hypothetical protein
VVCLICAFCFACGSNVGSKPILINSRTLQHNTNSNSSSSSYQFNPAKNHALLMKRKQKQKQKKTKKPKKLWGRLLLFFLSFFEQMNTSNKSAKIGGYFYLLFLVLYCFLFFIV